jgi:hypothetical protein
MPQDLKIAFVAQPEYNAPLYETDLDDLYEIRRFPIVFYPAQRDVATATSMADLITLAPDIAVFFRPDFINNDVLRRLTGLKIAISTEPYPKYISGAFHYTSDSIKRLKLLTRVAVHQFDYLIHYDQASLSFLELMGLRVSGPFVLPVATRIWRPPEQPNHTRDLTHRALHRASRASFRRVEARLQLPAHRARHRRTGGSRLLPFRADRAQHPRRARTVVGAAGAAAHGLRANRRQRANLAE